MESMANPYDGGVRDNLQSEYQNRSSSELLLEYKRTYDFKIKQELTLRYAYIVRAIAKQMRDVYVNFAQLDDIISEGIIVIMKGIDKFDPEVNVKFETYISKRIRGMIIDMARKQDWVPRSVRRSAKEIDQVSADLYNRYGRHASEQEMAEHLNMPLEKYQEIVGKTTLFNILSLDVFQADDEDNKKAIQVLSDNDREQPESRYLEGELLHYLAEAIQELRPNEQKVIALYYIEELNMKEIAKVMNVSEPRISQIHANAIRKLRISMNRFT